MLEAISPWCELLAEDDLARFHAGIHARAYRFMGAHPCVSRQGAAQASGVSFAVWAPNASRVSVVGDFNQWDDRKHLMRKHEESGVWQMFVPQASVGERYKFALWDKAGSLQPLKADPYARAAEFRPANASVIAPALLKQGPPALKDTGTPYSKPLSIYEVHAGSWRRHADGGFYSWDELAATLPDYAASLKFTHIELLPISEHPFDGSWGYQTLGLFAPSARFGDADGLRRFVQACHDKGLGVILDWVPAHFPLDAHGLAQFDGTALFEYADPREGFHQDWNTAIYNFARHEVRSFLRSSALYWFEQFGIDGLRVDAVASMLYRDYSRKPGEWIPNAHGGRENLEVISLLKDINACVKESFPDALMIAEESTAFPRVSYPLEEGGLGFSCKWNMGWMNDTLRYMGEDPVHRRWHHHKITFGLSYAFSERFVLPLSHDEVVHGKRSLLGRMPGDDWQRFANLRAYYGFMWGHPGKKLLFMGQEFAQPDEWNHDKALPWELLHHERHKQMQTLLRDLNSLYRQHAPLHERDCVAEGFEWLIADDEEQSVFAWCRRDARGRGMIVVSNFTPVPREHYQLAVPDGPSGAASAATSWHEVLNTDAAAYGGSNLGNMSAVIDAKSRGTGVSTHSIEIILPPLSTIYLAEYHKND